MESSSQPPSPSLAAVALLPPRRRRLWQLPPEHRALVVGLSLPPPGLRTLAEQVLGRLHRVRVELQGSDADVLASVLHDLGARNALSEAVHSALERLHAPVHARCAALRDAEALRQAWQHALVDGAVAGHVWALLTHAQGEALQEALLIDARSWLFSQARAAQALGAAKANAVTRDATLRAQLLGLQQRLQSQQAAADTRQQALAGEMARLRGERDAWRQAALRVAGQPPGSASAASAASAAAGVGGRAGMPQPHRPQGARAVELPAATRAMPRPRHAEQGQAAADAPASADAPAPSLGGRRVLCVGGMPGALPRYRALVETAGAEFDFHDGGIEQGLQRLDRQLLAADLVVCQTGCLNHEAYRRVKAHCRRTTKPCLYAERPSLTHFARTLGLAVLPVAGAS